MNSTTLLPTWKAVVNFLRELPIHPKTEVYIKPETTHWNVEVTAKQKSKKPAVRKSGIGVALHDLSW